MVPSFESARGRGVVASVFLGVCLCTGLARLLANGILLSLLSKAQAGLSDPAQFAALESAENVRVVIQIGSTVFAVIAFIAWMHAAYRNAEVLGAPHLRYSRGWTIGAWFVPLLNLVRPYQIMREIALASDPNIVTESRHEREKYSTPGTVKLWWTFYVLMAFLGRISAKMLDENPTLNQVQSASYLEMVLGALVSLAALFAILTIRKIDRDQLSTASNIAMSSTVYGQLHP
jgi:hypothetical protein